MNHCLLSQHCSGRVEKNLIFMSTEFFMSLIQEAKYDGSALLLPGKFSIYNYTLVRRATHPHTLYTIDLN